jgi:hypothetical protein
MIHPLTYNVPDSPVPDSLHLFEQRPGTMERDVSKQSRKGPRPNLKVVFGEDKDWGQAVY